MKTVLIGSAAWYHIYSNYGDSDYDFLVDQLPDHIKFNAERILCDNNPYLKEVYVMESTTLTSRREFIIPEEGSALDYLLKMDHPVRTYLDGFKIQIAGLPFLTALKKAHLILPHKWINHIALYNKMKNLLEVEVFNPKDWGDEVYKLFKMHRKESIALAKSHPKLNVNKDEFFNENEDYNIIDHDSIHIAVAQGKEPAYTFITDGEVHCSKKKWDALDKETKIRCVVEEASVLALERSIIPALFTNTTSYKGMHWAYSMALEKVCTTITSGWFRDYAIEHWAEVKNLMPDLNGILLNGLRNGSIKISANSILTGK